MSLCFVAGYHVDFPKRYYQVLKKNKQGEISKLEYGFTQTLGERKKRYQKLRLSPEEVRYYLDHWGEVESKYKLSLVALGYVLTMGTEFEKGRLYPVTDEVQLLILDLYAAYNSQNWKQRELNF